MIYYAQQMSFYPADYIYPDCPAEHYLETVERFEEDLTDHAKIHRPMSAIIEVGDAIEISPAKDKSSAVMPEIEQRLTSMLDGLKHQRPALS